MRQLQEVKHLSYNQDEYVNQQPCKEAATVAKRIE